MQKPPRITTYSLSAETTLDDLRALVIQTKSIDGSARVELYVTRGQRDQTYPMVQITETDW